MNAAAKTVTIDTRELEREVFPALLAYGRRTLQEQCVTSATFMAFNWQKGIPFTEIATIDAELDTVVRVTKDGRTWTRGMTIAQQRTNPNSAYSLATGNRWPLAKPTGSNIQKFQYYQAAAERMKLRRHSSTHFIQSGCTPIIREGLISPYYKYNSAFGSRREAKADRNPLNTINPEQLGGLIIDLKGDDCVVTGYNAVGENEGESNDVLAAKHRRAAIEHGVPALEAAEAQERTSGYAELQRRVDLGWKMKYPQWS